MQRIERGAVVDRDGRRLGCRHTVRHREHRTRRMRDLFGEPAATEEDDPLAHLEVGDAVTEHADGAGQLAPRREARSGLHLVDPPTLQHVGERQPDGLDIDEHLPRPSRRCILLHELELLSRFSEFAQSPDSHAPTVGATGATRSVEASRVTSRRIEDHSSSSGIRITDGRSRHVGEPADHEFGLVRSRRHDR